MTPDTDNRLEDWLREGPRDAPDTVLTNVVRGLDATPQERSNWVSSSARLVFGGAVGAAAIAAVVFAVSVGAGRNETTEPAAGGPTPTTAVPSSDCRVVVTADTPNGGRQDVSPPYTDIVASHSGELGLLVNGVQIRPLDPEAWGPRIDWTATPENGREESGTDESAAGSEVAYHLGTWNVVLRSTTTECEAAFPLEVILPPNLDAETPEAPTLGGTPGTMVCSIGLCDGRPTPTTDSGWIDLLAGLDALPRAEVPADLGSANDDQPVVGAWLIGQDGAATYLDTFPEVGAASGTRYVIAAIRPLDSAGNTLPYLTLFAWEIPE